MASKRWVVKFGCSVDLAKRCRRGLERFEWRIEVMASGLPIEKSVATNADLPFRSAGFQSLVDGLNYAALGDTGFNFYSPRGELADVLPYKALRERAISAAKRIHALGLKRGDRMGIVADSSVQFVVSFFTCQYAGLIPVPLPLSINFGGREAYVERLRGMLVAAGARGAIAPADLVDTVWEAAQPTAVRFAGTLADIEAGELSDEELRPLGPGEACYIQYSSGSTSFPRGVLVTQEALVANAQSISEHGLKLTGKDRCVSWLPLYHDMGLVGCCLTPVMNQISVDFLATSSFARRPLVWLKLMSENRATISFSPTFGYELCAKRAAKQRDLDLDLSTWRAAGIGGEMIRPSALETFAETFSAYGFDPKAMLASYGMAEATLAVTFARLGDGVTSDRILRGEPMERRHLAVPVDQAFADGQVRNFTRCGRALPGYQVEIRDDRGRRLADRHIGRICIQGPSLMGGYFRNPQATTAVIGDDGWLDSGDMGYLIEGELVVTGRTKDLIIVSGRNIWPQDLEWAVEHIEGVRQGDVAAFSVTNDDDQEEVVVLVECRTQIAEEIELKRREIAAVLSQRVGVACRVVLAPVRSLTFTTSGKLSRAAAKSRFLEGAIADLASSTSIEPTQLKSVKQAMAV